VMEMETNIIYSRSACALIGIDYNCPDFSGFEKARVYSLLAGITNGRIPLDDIESGTRELLGFC